jgi:hypothetical protein
VEPWLQSHIREGHVDRSFSYGRTINSVYMIGMIAMIAFGRLCGRRKAIDGPIGARIGRIGPTCARDCAWPCTCADKPSQFLYMYMCTHAQNGFANSLKQTACTLFHGLYFIDIDKTQFLRGIFSIAAHRLKFLCALHKTSKSCAQFRSIRRSHILRALPKNIKIISRSEREIRTWKPGSPN